MSCFRPGFDRAPLPMRLVCSLEAADCCRPCLLLPLRRAATGTPCAQPLSLALHPAQLQARHAGEERAAQQEPGPGGSAVCHPRVPRRHHLTNGALGLDRSCQPEPLTLLPSRAPASLPPGVPTSQQPQLQGGKRLLRPLPPSISCCSRWPLNPPPQCCVLTPCRSRRASACCAPAASWPLWTSTPTGGCCVVRLMCG